MLTSPVIVSHDQDEREASDKTGDDADRHVLGGHDQARDDIGPDERQNTDQSAELTVLLSVFAL
ncbi:hypothetical protein [Rhizobium multihospitium]|uniref:hypothetical protein n=1 Tax=Rhizobium multihospitium TaxID=410764 RepID=UPI003CCA3926